MLRIIKKKWFEIDSIKDYKVFKKLTKVKL